MVHSFTRWCGCKIVSFPGLIFKLTQTCVAFYVELLNDRIKYDIACPGVLIYTKLSLFRPSLYQYPGRLEMTKCKKGRLLWIGNEKGISVNQKVYVPFIRVNIVFVIRINLYWLNVQSTTVHPFSPCYVCMYIKIEHQVHRETSSIPALHTRGLIGYDEYE